MTFGLYRNFYFFERCATNRERERVKKPGDCLGCSTPIHLFKIDLARSILAKSIAFLFSDNDLFNRFLTVDVYLQKINSFDKGRKID